MHYVVNKPLGGGQNEEKLATGPHEIRPVKSVQGLEAAAYREDYD